MVVVCSGAPCMYLSTPPWVTISLRTELALQLALPVAAGDGRRSSQAVTLVMSLHYVHAVIDAGHVHNAHSLSCRVAYS